MSQLEKLYKKDGKTNGNNMKKISITYQEIANIANNLKKPNVQTSLDDDKIFSIYEILKAKTFNLLFGPIIIAVLKHDTDIEFWLVDGQHRIEAAIRLNKEDKNDNLECVFVDVQNQNDTEKLFELVNQDSFKNKWIINSDIFQKNLVKEFKIMLETKYKGCFRIKSSKASHIMTIDEFMNKLIELELLEDWPDGLPSIEDLCERLEDCNEIFIKKVHYLETLTNKDCYHPEEINILGKHKVCIFFKNNNFCSCFIDCLYKKEILPKHDYKNNREALSKKVKNVVWKKMFGSKKMGDCPIPFCENKLEKDYIICGHVISVANGGSNEPDNLKPICANCNTKMSSVNWNDYVLKIIYEKQKNKCFTCKKKIKSMTDALVNDDKIYCEQCNIPNANSDNE
jgi:hypothetical protein